jgi:hypothetical protein
MHKYDMVKFNNDTDSQTFSFYYNSNKELQKLRVSHEKFGDFDFHALRPV